MITLGASASEVAERLKWILNYLPEGDELFEEEVGGDGLARSAFSTYNDALRLLLVQHGVVRRISHGEYVRRILRFGSIAIQIHFLIQHGGISFYARQYKH